MLRGRSVLCGTSFLFFSASSAISAVKRRFRCRKQRDRPLTLEPVPFKRKPADWRALRIKAKRSAPSFHEGGGKLPYRRVSGLGELPGSPYRCGTVPDSSLWDSPASPIVRCASGRPAHLYGIRIQLLGITIPAIRRACQRFAEIDFPRELEVGPLPETDFLPQLRFQPSTLPRISIGSRNT